MMVTGNEWERQEERIFRFVFCFWIAWTWKITKMEGAKETKVYSLNDSA